MLRAKDIMNQEFVTVPATMPIGDLVDLLQSRNIKAAPVLDSHGRLAGMVSIEDILYGTMGGDSEERKPERIRSRGGMLELHDLDTLSPEAVDPWSRSVAEIMTNPAITVTPDMGVKEVCKILWSLRIHHLPVCEEDKVVGLISTLDLCRSVVDGRSIP